MEQPTVNWERLDKHKFFVVGAGLFTGLTTALYPLTVIKTRQMALENTPSGISGMVATGRSVLAVDGVRGLYKGFGTVVAGMIPARMLYMSTLELTKSSIATALAGAAHMEPAAVAGAASFAAGAAGSVSALLVTVPMDVISQRLMIMGGEPAAAAMQHGRRSPAAAAAAAAPPLPSGTGRVNGWTLARQIVAAEGIGGLYRGLGASVATFVPNSAIWWASYGLWQQLMWQQMQRFDPGGKAGEGDFLLVQASSGILTGITTATLTNPLDVVKTRIQTADASVGKASLAWSSVFADLVRREGAAGLWRGVAPRMMSSALWGTAMVTAYEFLKRLCVLPAEPLAETS